MELTFTILFIIICRQVFYFMLYFISSLAMTYICRCGGIGRRTRLKIWRETLWVRVPPSVPMAYLFELTDNKKINHSWLIFLLLYTLELWWHVITHRGECFNLLFSSFSFVISISATTPFLAYLTRFW